MISIARLYSMSDKHGYVNQFGYLNSVFFFNFHISLIRADIPYLVLRPIYLGVLICFLDTNNKLCLYNHNVFVYDNAKFKQRKQNQTKTDYVHVYLFIFANCYK